MRTSILALATTLLATCQLVSSTPVPVHAPVKRTVEWALDLTTTSTTTTTPPRSVFASSTPGEPVCRWMSAELIMVFFKVVVPGGDEERLRTALRHNAACSGFSNFRSERVGPDNASLAAGFWASDFCTAWQVTKVLEDAFGRTIDCNEWDNDDGDYPV